MKDTFRPITYLSWSRTDIICVDNATHPYLGAMNNNYVRFYILPFLFQLLTLQAVFKVNCIPSKMVLNDTVFRSGKVCMSTNSCQLIFSNAFIPMLSHTLYITNIHSIYTIKEFNHNYPGGTTYVWGQR